MQQCLAAVALGLCCQLLSQMKMTLKKMAVKMTMWMIMLKTIMMRTGVKEAVTTMTTTKAIADIDSCSDVDGNDDDDVFVSMTGWVLRIAAQVENWVLTLTHK
jgi:hypothetical protein